MTKRKNPAAVALGKRGGKNSRKNLAPEERTALAKKAAEARWGSKSARKALTKREPPKKTRTK